LGEYGCKNRKNMLPVSMLAESLRASARRSVERDGWQAI
jgi:hypothetical protein